MEYRSIFITAYKTLRQSKLAWLFGLAIGLLYPMPSLFKLIPANLAILLCCLELAFLFLYIASPLGLLITLYYDYLIQPPTFRAVWKLIGTNMIRWTGLLVLLYLPYLILVGYYARLIAESNYLIVLLITHLLNSCLSFLLNYIFLTILQYKYGFWNAIKQGARVLVKRLDIKFGIVLFFSIIYDIFYFLLVLSQSRLLSTALTLHDHDLTAYSNSMSSFIPLTIFIAIVDPITVAIAITIYFRDVKDDTILQNVGQ